ncbi:hypothetical protein JA1_000935 [Spathaspora sp. JA1]|nr:hypothetical protein JA1_000935 [Spathaspora sp. JA1]
MSIKTVSSTKEELSLFSFNSQTSSSSPEKNNNHSHHNNNHNNHNSHSNPTPGDTSPKHSVASIISENDDGADNYNIFERSVQDSCVFEPGLRSDSIVSLVSATANSQFPPQQQNRRPRSSTHNSSISLATGQYLKNEDYIPPAIDATASLLYDKQTNLDDVEIVYSNRRNSSVVALNMALGRPISPSSRKNSLMQVSYSNQSTPLSSVPSSTNSNTSQQQLFSPVSPPKLTTSKSSLNFYSYAEMINNQSDDYPPRRPSFKHAYSQGFIPAVKQQKPLPKPTRTSSQLTMNLSKSKKKNLHNINTTTSGVGKNNFLISPDSSDSDEIEELSGLQLAAGGIAAAPRIRRNKSVGSGNSGIGSDDNDSLISTSLADCIRQTTTEINGH